MDSSEREGHKHTHTHTHTSTQTPTHPYAHTGIPSVRYAHASVALPGYVFVTHGYKYAHHGPGVGPDYMSDTWRYGVAEMKVCVCVCEGIRVRGCGWERVGVVWVWGVWLSACVYVCVCVCTYACVHVRARVCAFTLSYGYSEPIWTVSYLLFHSRLAFAPSPQFPIFPFPFAVGSARTFISFRQSPCRALLPLCDSEGNGDGDRGRGRRRKKGGGGGGGETKKHGGREERVCYQAKHRVRGRKGGQKTAKRQIQDPVYLRR